MSRIDDLIAQCCPNGVEFKNLGDIVTNHDSRRRPVTRGSRVAGDYPYYGANGVQDWVSDFIYDGTFLLLGEDGSVLTGKGRPVLNWATGKIWVNNHAHVLTARDDSVELRYLYFYLSTVDISAFVTGGTQPKLNQANMNRIRVAVPPVEVQREIAHVLDCFAELEAELEARRLQYSYYSELLLAELSDFDRRVPLSNALITIIDHRGKTPAKLGGDWSDTGHRVISALNMKDGRVDDNDHHYISSSLFRIWMKTPLEEADVLLTSEAPLGALAMARGLTNCAIGQRMYALRPKPWMLDSRYLYHQLRAGRTRQDLLSRATGSTVSGIRQSELVKVEIDLPPLLEQRRVAGVLDQFETLCRDLRIGLPAEINARRQQYEYYRDRLLTFEEVVA